MSSVLKSLNTTLEMIKIEHTLFALPFAFLGAVLAVRGLPADQTLWGVLPSAWTILWIVGAMVGARSAAMAFNRLTDQEFDAANPRTKIRALPAGLLTPQFVWVFVIASSALFLISAAMLNRLTLILSPIALGSVLFYSYTKRFTSLSHLVLGWSLAIAPTGAWIAVRGHLDSPVPLLLSLSVMLWTAGFDVIYACQDVEFDRGAGLHSIPQRLGVAGGLWVARALHVLMFAALIAFFYFARLGWLGLVGVIATGALLIYQHSIVKKDDLSRVNAAFFTTNAFVSLILFLTGFGDLLIR